jgi:heme/copper-type cytochrome/quinol oxidase subunit 4
MAIPEIAGVSLTNPYLIGGAIVVIIAIVGGILWWLHKEGKLKMPF